VSNEKFPWTHAVPTGRGYRLFCVGKCPNCGAKVKEPNGLFVHRETEVSLRRLGVEILDRMPLNEVWPDDARGGYGCDRCL
jgi:hypothetical protein